MRERKDISVRKIPNEIFFEQLKDILSEGQSVKINVTGRSMDPTFKDGKDVIVVSPFKAETLSVGDVVLFDRGDTICVHRIISRKGDKLIIRGDGNPRKALEPATVNDVIGIVTGGTFRGGKPFVTTDLKWKRNTAMIRRFYPLLCAWHKCRIFLMKYPLSILVLLLLMYLLFVDPSTFQQFSSGGSVSDKLVHALMYAGLSTVFWFEWIKNHGINVKSFLRGSVHCVLFPIILGGINELAQAFLTGGRRQGDWFDFMANALGTLTVSIGIVFVLAPIVKYFRHRNKA